MDNEVKEILMQLVDTTNKLAEGQKRTDERLDKMSADITDMKKDITQLKTDAADMKKDITQLKTDAADMKKDITQLKTDVAGMKEDITEMKEDITELKRETKITRVNVNHNGEVLEQMVKDLAPLNMLNVKY